MKIKQLKPYLMLWSTQSFSALGSGMTSYALVLWLYLRTGSALGTALLSVCSYAPYVVMSIFAGALSDRWNKKRTMLVCDLLAALSTAAVFLLIKADALNAWHLYILNALNGLMNTVQQPASEVAATLLIPKDYYQKTGGLRSFSQSLNSILTPVLATALFAFGGINAVIAVDLITFAFAFIVLLFFIHIPESGAQKQNPEKLLTAAWQGVAWLRRNPLILTLAYQVAMYHHEKWNGKGYPEGKKRKEIPLCARIMAVADVFDAVSQNRCYRKAMPLDRCFDIISDGSGQDFEPVLVEVFLDIRDRVEEVHHQINDVPNEQ